MIQVFILGTGFGVIVSVSYTLFNSYFVNKRILMMSIAQSLLGLGSIGVPILYGKLLEWYGFRGCLAIIGAINGHCILGMLVMHPVEWHMKLVEIVADEVGKFISKKII